MQAGWPTMIKQEEAIFPWRTIVKWPHFRDFLKCLDGNPSHIVERAICCVTATPQFSHVVSHVVSVWRLVYLKFFQSLKILNSIMWNIQIKKSLVILFRIANLGYFIQWLKVIKLMKPSICMFRKVKVPVKSGI